MNEPHTSRQRFSYTADRSGFMSSAGGWILLFVLEGSVVATLIVIFAPGPTLKIALLALYVAGLLYLILAKFCAPLWTRHELLADRLDLHYGGASISIPRRAIASAGPLDSERGHRFRPGPEHDPKSSSLVVTFSAKGMVELRLTQPEQLDVVATSEPVDRVVFNVDRRDAFLTALANTTPVLDPGTATSTGTPTVIDKTPVTTAVLTRGLASENDTLAIATHGLEARFGDRVAVEELDLAIRHGEIYTLLGANGAGKTTTLKMLVGLIAPSRGTIRIAGHDLMSDGAAVKRAFGYMPDRAILYDRLSGREFLQFLAQMRGIPTSDAERRIDRLLAMFDLEDRRDSPAASYSFGMKRKLSLAGALLHEPSVLILDEPLNGLDPPGARQLRDLLMERSRDGVGILLSTHDLAAAESLSDRIGIMHRGHLLAEGTIEDLTAGVPGPTIHRLEAAFLRATGATPSEHDAAR
jgi:ABC-2 type transport system ATP-binding protein